MADPSFGSRLPRDGNSAAIQAPSRFICQDATGTPVLSPIAYTTAVGALIVPDNAVALRLNPSTDLRYSADGDDIQSTVTDGYMLAPAGVESVVPVAALRGSSIYYTRDASNGSLRFRFDLIGA